MQAVHLIILIHGLYGTPVNLAVVQSELKLAAENSYRSLPAVSYVTQSFTGSHTWDGIDVNAHRAAKEVRKMKLCRLIVEVNEEVERLENEGKDIVAFSVVRVFSSAKR